MERVTGIESALRAWESQRLWARRRRWGPGHAAFTGRGRPVTFMAVLLVVVALLAVEIVFTLLQGEESRLLGSPVQPRIVNAVFLNQVRIAYDVVGLAAYATLRGTPLDHLRVFPCSAYHLGRAQARRIRGNDLHLAVDLGASAGCGSRFGGFSSQPLPTLRSLSAKPSMTSSKSFATPIMRLSDTSSTRFASLRSYDDMPVPHPVRASSAAAATDRAIHFRTRILRYVVYGHAVRQAVLYHPRRRRSGGSSSGSDDAVQGVVLPPSASVIADPSSPPRGHCPPAASPTPGRVQEHHGLKARQRTVLVMLRAARIIPRDDCVQRQRLALAAILLREVIHDRPHPCQRQRQQQRVAGLPQHASARSSTVRASARAPGAACTSARETIVVGPILGMATASSFASEGCVRAGS